MRLTTVHREAASTRDPFVRIPPGWKGALVAAFIGLGLAAGVAGITMRSEETWLVLYSVFLLYLMLLTVPLLMNVGWFHPLAFYVLWHGLISLVRGDVLLASGALESHRNMPWIGQEALDLVVAKSFSIEILSLMGLYAGFFLAPRLKWPALGKVRPSWIEFKVVVWTAGSLCALVILASAAGGFSSLLLQRGDLAENRVAAQIGAHWHFLISAGGIVPAVWVAFRPQAVRSLLFWIVTVSSLSAIFVATGSRSSLILPLFQMGVIWSLRRQRVPYRNVVIAFVCATVILGLLGGVREATRGAVSLQELDYEPEVQVAVTEGLRELLTRGLSNSGQLAVVGAVPEKHDYLMGQSYLSILYVALPRAIVGDKPAAASRLNAAIIHDRPGTGIPTGTVGEAFWNFSYLGPLLVFFMYGVFLALMSQIYAGNHRNAIVVILYAFVLFQFRPGSDGVYDFIHASFPALIFSLLVVARFGTSSGRLRRVVHQGSIAP